MLPSVPLVRPARALQAVVVASGFAGLGYEMVWTRLLSVTLGTDMLAVLGSIAGLFAGLAAGAFLLDGPLRRTRSPRRADALREGVIGAALLPALTRLVPTLVGAHPSAGLLWAASFALPALALLPATMAMGGTLTVLERLMVNAGGQPRCSAAVYAANTAGAVAGTLCSVALLFPWLGLTGALLALVAVNALCALGALRWGKDVTPVSDLPASPPLAAGADRQGRADDGLLWITLLLTGLLGIAVEVLVIRLAAQLLQDTLYTFAGLLCAYLTGTALGSIVYQRIVLRGARPSAAMLLGITALACLATALLMAVAHNLAAPLAAAGLAGELLVAFALLLLPSAAMGALFGHLLQQVKVVRGSIGWAVGINSVGAALAPAVASLLLIPAFGTFHALVLVAGAYLALTLPRRAALGWWLAPAALAAGLLMLPAPLLVRVPAGGQLLALREGPMMTAGVVEDGGGVRYLEINGHFRMGGTSSQRSDDRQAMLPLLLHPAPHRALFLGLGTGATLLGGARVPGVTVQGVELSPEVVELLPWFVGAGRAAAYPAVTTADARRFVVADRERYDVIVADLFHPALDGSGALYTTEHFAAVRQRLAPGGLFCQWLPLYQLDEPSLRAIMASFLAVYPQGTAWLNHYSVRTPMLALVGYAGGASLDVAALATNLARPPVAAVTRPLGLASAQDVLGQLVAGPAALAAYVQHAPANTDDRPFVALDARRNVQALSAPPAALLVRLIHAVHAGPQDLAGPAGLADDGLPGRMAAYWRARDRFLEAGAALQGEPRGAALMAAASPGLLDALRLSADFDPAYQPLLGMARALLAANPAEGQRLLQAIVQAAPARQEARALLAQLQASQGVPAGSQGEKRMR